MTGCTCEQPTDGKIIYCERHKVDKPPHFVELCQTRENYFRAWEEGHGPRQNPPGGKSKISRQPASGPGTELTAILGSFGIRPGGCKCKAVAAKMDAKGPVWCRKNIDQIASTMYQQAKKRKMSLAALSPPAIRLLIRWAIRRAEAKE